MTGLTVTGDLPPSLPDATTLLAILALDSEVVVTVGASDSRRGWTFDSGATAFDGLAAGDTLTLTYEITAEDTVGATGSRTIVIEIAGSNDPAAITGALTGTVRDGAAAAVGGTLLVSDPDRFEQAIIAKAATDGDYGTFAVDALGNWTYALADGNAAVTALDDGETLTERFDVASVDGTTAAVVVTIEGADEVQPPAARTLAISASDRSAPGQTEASQVTLQGTSQPGTTVKLFGPDGLLAEALTRTDGSFKLTGVQLPLGETALRLTATDPATGLTASLETALTRAEPAADAPANAVLQWIDIALDVITASGTTPDFASRALAMQSVAANNALAAIDGRPGYLTSPDVSGDPDPALAIAHAAHGVLSELFAGQRQLLDAALAAATGQAADADAVALGTAAAQGILALRQADGAFAEQRYLGAEADGVWRPTGPAYLDALNPHWADLAPFTLADGDQFRPVAPPSLFTDTIAGHAYANDLERVRALGASDSTDRTAEQTEIARFWAAGRGTETPPGHWNRIAATVSEAEGLSSSQTAELMLKLNLALADAAIAAWDTKYAYGFWRPVTVLNEGGLDNGDPIPTAPGWAPLVNTPNHPEYVSGHSTYSGAAATVLTDAFGASYAFTDTASSTSGPITRSFTSFWDAAEEGGESRIFGGIHFDFSNVTGLALGEDVAEWVLGSFDPLTDAVAPTLVLTDEPAVAINGQPVFEGIVANNLSGVVDVIASVAGLSDTVLRPAPDGTFSFAPTLPGSGEYEITFIARDAAGNASLIEREIVVAETAPVIGLDVDSVSDANPLLTADARSAGEVTPAGAFPITSLTVQVGDGPVRPVPYDEVFAFNIPLDDIDRLAPGDVTIKLTATDAAGNETVETIDASLAVRTPFRAVDVTPEDNQSAVSTTGRPFVGFSRPVDPETVTEQSFFVRGPDGTTVPGEIVLTDDRARAYIFFDAPMPGSTAIEVVVVSDLIRAADGATLDADTDGVPGGTLVQRFTTVSLTGLPGTTLTGRVVDPGADLNMMTPDDFIVGPGGVTDYANHTYRNPITGAEVYIVGLEDRKVVTDENGFFELTEVPAGQVVVTVDGRTATNAPDGVFWPEMILDVTVRPGQANTIMGGMGPLEAQLDRQKDPAFFLPRLPSDLYQPLSDTEPTVIRPVSGAGTDLTHEQLDLISLTV